jgi:hypothetical protein
MCVRPYQKLTAAKRKLQLLGGIDVSLEGGANNWINGVETVAPGSVAASLQVGPGECCSPRHRVQFNSRDEGSKCVGLYGKQYLP